MHCKTYSIVCIYVPDVERRSNFTRKNHRHANNAAVEAPNYRESQTPRVRVACRQKEREEFGKYVILTASK